MDNANTHPEGNDRDGQDSTLGDDRPPLYGLGVNHSSSTILEDVEMAHDEVFSGPMAESLPTSVTAFAHHRPRADSMTSFIYYDDAQDRDFESPSPSDLDAQSDVENMRFLDMDGALAEEADDDVSEYDRRPSGDDYINIRRRSSLQSRDSIRARLLRRDSLVSMASSRGQGRTSQKVYMANEDLTIVIAGFKTCSIRSALYKCLCIATLGLAYLLFRWLPRLYIKLVGIPSPLRECGWVVIENQWGELAVLQVTDLAYGRSLSTVFGPASRLYSSEEDPDPDLARLRRVDYRYVRFCYHPLYDKFVLCNGWRDPAWTDVHALRSGLGSDDKGVRELVFGQNLIDIEQKSTFRLLVDEVLHPFYIFQAASLLLWSLDEYYYYAACIFIMSFGSITTTLLETRSTMRRLREISRFECDVRVLRSGFWRYISSSDLVPGDVYEVSDPNLTQFPSDSLLLSGDCIVNESMLTGESVPVSKVPAVDKTVKQLDLGASTVSADIAKHFLFCGTKLIRARRPQEDRHGEAVALAIVLRTGFNTTKGSLVRSMLFPKPSGFKFYRDSFRYISVMASVAFLGFIASFINFIRLRLAWHLIIVRALDLITIIVPPALPATLTIGTNFALSRLKQKQIFCISPQRVNVAGKLDIMCFDKTGTLTEDGLDILGVRIVSRSRNRFGKLLTSPSDMLSTSPARGHAEDELLLKAALHTMATCHSLRSIDNDLVGDPLDLKMFQFTQWEFEEGGQSARDGEDDEHGSLSPSVARPPRSRRPSQGSNGSLRGPEPITELGVLRCFEFVSQLRRASVIVRVFGSQSGDIYVKGAPECMRDICRPETIPNDYDELLAQYTHRGFRVIGCATRHIKKLSWVKAQKMRRHEAERQLDFVGFIIFENKLKPSTAAVIDELRTSNISNVMVTGDNILTAISVARECNLIDKTSHCFVPHFAQGTSGDPNSQLKWESIDNSRLHLDGTTLKPLPLAAEGDAPPSQQIASLRNYSIAVTGEIFRWIVDYAPPETLKRVLVCGRVFARMSPDEKHELVEKLQSIDYCCGFCGDGANDCGALKAADVGISLSEAEASVAAPFTSRIFDIRCVPQVIREGRAALVTSFSCFKYMSLYSAIQFTSVSFLYASASNLGDFQFLFIDLLLILPVAIFMSWAGPFPVLSKKRPTADLVSRKVLTPLLGQICICILIQTASWVSVRKQDWYVPPHVDPNQSNIKNSENTALFLVSCFEYILSGVVLNAGPPFRQGMLQNWPFVATIAIAVIITLDMVLAPSHWLRKLMQLTKIPTNFKWYLVGLGVSYIIIAWFCEHYLFPPVARFIGKARLVVTGTRKKRKEYKNILDRVHGNEDV